jgi:dTDP-4-amino-4,6-dideoxygalactose transaminase
VIGAEVCTEYERAVARATGAGHAVAFRFGRTAIAAVLEAGGVRPGDEVLLSPLTCRVVPLAILAAGFTPRYVDLEPGGLNLDPDRVAADLSPRVRAVLFQRTYGTPTGATAVAAWAAERGLMFVEDCAQCLPSTEAWVGEATSGVRAAVFSNNAGKPLPAAAGGVAVTHLADLATRTRAAALRLPEASMASAIASQIVNRARNRWLTSPRYWAAFDLVRRIDASYTERPLDEEIAAEIRAVAARPHPIELRAGRTWLGRLDAVARHRREVVAAYRTALASVAAIPTGADGPLYYFPVLVPDKPRLLEAARRRRVEVVPWPLRTPIYPVETPAALAAYGYDLGRCPEAEAVAERLVGLPTHPLISRAARERILDLITRHLAGETT